MRFATALFAAAALLLVATAAAAARPALPKVGTVCIVNDGGFRMKFNLKDLDTNRASNATADYDVLRTKCLYIGDALPGALHGDLIMCRAEVDAGEQHDCATAVMYNNATSEVATFSCRGTTLDYSCKLI
jgi:hypothetical protein